MSTYDWSQFTQRISIQATVKVIYEAWTTRSNLEKWFLRKAEFRKADGTIREPDSSIQAGDSYEWMWHGYDTKENGTVTEVNGKDLLRFTFAKCDVTVSISEEDGECTCDLTQSNIPTDEESKAKLHVGCTEGWTFYFANLKSILEVGHDLRNKKPQKKTIETS